jgi:ATP-dependent exoDNAse (exonuclease V) alpha subunit
MAMTAEQSRKKKEEAKALRIAAAAVSIERAGLSGGYDRAHKAAAAAFTAADALSERESAFGFKKWVLAFAKAAGDGWLDDPQWGAFRGLIAKAAGLIPLAPSQEEQDWALWAPTSHLKAEEEMLEFAKREDTRHAIPRELVEKALADRPSMEGEQREAAIASCLSDKAVVVTEGTAGAGKSYTLEAIREVYENVPETKLGEGVGYEIVGTALSWTAAKVLQESAKLTQAQALQGLLMEMDRAEEAGASFFKRRTLVVVDEAGLVGTMKMRALLRHAARAPVPVRVLLTGDSLQLNPVEPGNALESIVEECGSSRLDIIRRQERPSHKAAVKHFSQGRAEQGLWTYWQQEALWMCEGPDERRERVMRDYVRIVAAHPMDSCLVLALENAEVKKLNESIRERLRAAGLLAGEEHELTVNDGAGPYQAKFCLGDRVVLRKNLRDQPVFESRYGTEREGAAAALEAGKKQESAGMFSKMLSGLASGRQEPPGPEIRKGAFNRTNGIVLGIRKSPSGSKHRLMRLLLSDGGETEIDTASLEDPLAESNARGIALHHNFATTIYASQGQTVHRVLLMDSPHMNRRLAYVGMSRHKIQCDVYADVKDLDQRRRARGKRELAYAYHPRAREKAQAIAQATSYAVGDLWAEMALAWNKEAANPTVGQAIKRMQEKREKFKREGSATGRLRPADGDDPDDVGAPPPKRPKPASYERLVASSREGRPAARKPGFFSSLVGAKAEPEPEPQPLEPEEDISALPAWSAEPMAAKALADLDGIVWTRSRWGEPRLCSLDKDGRKVARWTLDGQCVAGRSEPPVLPNAPQSPWLVVAGAREALISWAHFQAKHAQTPEKAPSLAVAFEDADLEALFDWVPKGSALHCAWSKRDPASLPWAQEMARKLSALGYRGQVYPKPPAPDLASRPSGP